MGRFASIAALSLLPLAASLACGGKVFVDPGTGGNGGSGSTVVASSTVGSATVGPASSSSGGVVDILEQLEAIPGATVVEETSEIDDYRFFILEFDQPVNHDDPSGPHFKQRLALHHRDPSAPFVLASTGYALWWLPTQYLEEPTTLLGANQVLVEHRYFSPSRPDPADWSLLDIRQAASDHHRIAEALHPIYTGKWISTGGSKGGMTSIYHRRFFPDDVDGTVAYVAPNIGTLEDPRFVEFLATVGDEPCRQRLRDFEREVLLRRDVVGKMLEEQGNSQGMTYDLLGVDAVVESTVLTFSFSFWQYSSPDLCQSIPDETASDDEVFAFFDQVGLPIFGADTYLLIFEPYYWQAQTELGTPGGDTSHLDDLLVYDWETIDDLPSIDLEPVFDPAPMQDVADWVATSGKRILFIYGEYDPWTAAAFDLGGAQESYAFLQPGGNHITNILDLPWEQATIALSALEDWTGVTTTPPPVPPSPRPAPPPLRLLRRFFAHK